MRLNPPWKLNDSGRIYRRTAFYHSSAEEPLLTESDNTPHGITDAQLPKNDPWNRDDPRALVNLVPEVASDHFFTASHKRADLFGQDERTLLKQLKEEKCAPTPTDNRLRIGFWMEYERAQSAGRDMELSHVFGGVCTKPYFYQVYLKCPEKVAWLVCQPSSYEKYADEAINFGLEQLRDVLEIPHVTYFEDGRVKNVDIKLADLKAKIVFGLEARRKGAVVQKNMNLNISSSDKKVAEAAIGGTMEELEKRLEDIRKRQRKARAEIEDKSEIEVKAEIVTDEKPSDQTLT